MTKKISQIALTLEYFKQNPLRPIEHPEAVDWLVKEYFERTGKVFRDPDRAIRSLAQRGQLVKVAKGVYKYDPDLVVNRELEDFTSAQREKIFERDEYRCVICGKGRQNGVEIHADHIKPKDLGGKAIIENGQTLCATHNFRKRNLKQTESGKKMFIRLYELAKASDDTEMVLFTSHILKVFERYDINGHIEWIR